MTPQSFAPRAPARGVDAAVILAFVLAIAVPGILGVVAVASAPLPDASEEQAKLPAPLALAGRARASFEERFGFRKTLIRWHSRIKLQLLGVSPSPTVLVGRDGWLFYADDGALKDYVSETPYGDDDLARWQHDLEDTRDWLRARAVAYLFVIVPDKHVVYPQYMPDTVRPLHERRRVDQVVEWMRAHSDVPVLDLRGPLSERAKVERVYHLTDSHWNERGALVGYREIEARLKALVAGFDTAAPAGFSPVERDGPGQDLARMLGIENVVGEHILGLRPLTPRVARVVSPTPYDPGFGEWKIATERPDTGRPRAVIFRDSFGSALLPFLAEDFSRAFFVWQGNVDRDVVLQERPQVVIQEMASRFFAIR